MSPSRLFVRPVVAALAAVSLLSAGGAQADTTLLNVSYDVARELYKEINPAFVAHWQRTAGEKLTINQSHGGSSKQIQSVIAGGVFIPADAPVEAGAASAGTDPVALTDREHDLLPLIVEGLSNQEIADRLHLSITTVKTHVANLIDKVGVQNRVQLAVYGYQRMA